MRKKIEELDPMRGKSLKIKLWKNVQFGINNDALDKNRLEQEMIYYLERLDIAEEQIRLRRYLSYFE